MLPSHELDSRIPNCPKILAITQEKERRALYYDSSKDLPGGKAIPDNTRLVANDTHSNKAAAQMIADYIRLQIRRMHRMVVEMGLHPILNYTIIVCMFLLLSITPFMHHPKYMIYYVVVALFAVSTWSNPEREDFLKTTFSRRDYYKVRLLENIITVLPFAVVLSISANYLPALGIFLIAVMMALLSFKVKWQIVIPTPFSRHAFEFVVGFRLSVLLFLGAYFLTYISILYANIGIGIFVIITTSVLCALFHSYMEDVYYVWIFATTAAKFLRYKILTAITFTMLLCLPALVALMIANPDKIVTFATIQSVGLVIVCLGVLAKYVAYPREMKLKEGMLLGFSMVIPPLLLFTVPYFYILAHRQLKEILA